MSLIKLLYSPNGKVNRANHAFALLINITIAISIYLVLVFLEITIGTDSYEPFLNIVFWLIILNFIISTIFVQIKRLRDLGMSGYCILWLLFPLVNLAFYWILFLVEGENQTDLTTD